MTKQELLQEFEINMPDGWYKAFGDLLVNELWDAIIEDNLEELFKIDQLKEKYGTLRIYTSGASERILHIIDKYEYISEHVCIECGQPDVGLTKHGWIIPVCRKCFHANFSKDIQYEDAVNMDNIELKDYYIRSIYKSGKLDIETYYIKPTVNTIRGRYI